MSTIGILGTGRVATALAGKLAGAGHDVTIGTRDVARASANWAGPAVTFEEPSDVARAAPVVVNATPSQSSLQRLSALREELDGKVLIDVSNATNQGQDGLSGTLCYPNSSLAEHLQEALPGTAVVKTLNTMLFSVMVDPHSLEVPPTAFVSGNDQDAKAIVSGLLGDLGWPPGWIEELGDVFTARGPEAFMLLVPHIVRSRGFSPFALTVAR